jgi:hypothetical protein
MAATKRRLWFVAYEKHNGGAYYTEGYADREAAEKEYWRLLRHPDVRNASLNSAWLAEEK